VEKRRAGPCRVRWIISCDASIISSVGGHRGVASVAVYRPKLGTKSGAVGAMVDLMGRIAVWVSQRLEPSAGFHKHMRRPRGKASRD